MGNLEKAGIAVVVILLGIILVVAFIGDPQDAGAGGQPKSGGNETASAPPPSGRPEAPPPSALESRRQTDNAQSNASVPSNQIREIGGRRSGEGARTEPPASEPSRGTAPGPAGSEESRTLRPPSTGTDATPGRQPSDSTGKYPREVKLAPGENLWALVAREYGSPLVNVMLKQVMKENGIRDGRKLKAGTVVKLPAPPEPKDKSEVAKAPAPAVNDGASKAPASGEKPASAKDRGAAPLSSKTRTTKPAATDDFLPFDPGTPASSSGSGSGRGSAENNGSSGTKSGAKTVVVRNGETLAQIARREMGSERYVKDIAELNRIKDVNKVVAGTKLKMPAR